MEAGKKTDPDLRGLLYSVYAKEGGEKKAEVKAEAKPAEAPAEAPKA